MSRIWRRTLAVGLAFTLLISSVSLPSLAQSTSAKPGDFFLQEWGVATAASSLVFIGGVWGNLHSVFSSFLEAFQRKSRQITLSQLDIEEEFNQLRVCYEGEDREACAKARERFLQAVWNKGLAQVTEAAVLGASSAAETAVPGLLATFAAIPVASTLAVIAVGSSNGVAGNIPLTILGSLGGMLTWGMITGFTVPKFNPDTSFVLFYSGSMIGSLTAFGATIGYNIGAKMRSEVEGASAEMGFTLPLFAMQF